MRFDNRKACKKLADVRSVRFDLRKRWLAVLLRQRFNHCTACKRLAEVRIVRFSRRK